MDRVTGDAGPSATSDFLAWRERLESVRELGAFRTQERNLITGEGRSEPVQIAEISATAFELARVPPLMGRALVDADEEMGAAPVVVIGHDVWQGRFAGAADVVETGVRLGAERHTVVGVMPEGFGFPVAHSFWVPLRLDAGGAPRGTHGPPGWASSGVWLPVRRSRTSGPSWRPWGSAPPPTSRRRTGTSGPRWCPTPG